MSETMIATIAVRKWMMAGVTKEDCDLHYVIEHLESAILDASRLEVELDDEYDDWLKLLRNIKMAMFHAMDNFTSLYNEVEDQIVPTHPNKPIV